MMIATLGMLHMARRLLVAAGLLLALLGAAHAAAPRAPLAPDDAFRLSASRTADGTLTLVWHIAPETYLYRDSLKAERSGAPVPLATLPGQIKGDPNFGSVEIYHAQAEATVPGLPAQGDLRLTFQGCAEAGICYPQMTRTIDLATLEVMTDAPVSPLARVQDSPSAVKHSVPEGIGRSDTPFLPQNDAATDGRNSATELMLGGSLPALMTAFLGFGLLLAFTPCVFPMLPILSGILAGGTTRASAGRGLLLSGSYGLAMASAYGVLGLAAGWSGANLQVALQTPWALGAMATIFVLLALSMLGQYELALPARFRFVQIGAGGSIAGAATLGFGSALVVGPCVTPPLAAAILYAAQSGDALRGGLALFMLGLGMALPLIGFGAFGARILPRSGPWMMAVRHACGVLFLGIAILLASRLLPPSAGLAMWGALAIGLGVFLGAFDRSRSQPRALLAQAAGVLAVIYGGTLVVGASGGGTDPLRPLGFIGTTVHADMLPSAETRVSSLGALQKAVSEVGTDGRPALVSFTADWCTVCKSNEAVMAVPETRRRLAGLPRITADVTVSSPDTRGLMTRFSVVGPPTFFLIDSEGRELVGSRLTGAITTADIERLAARAGL